MNRAKPTTSEHDSLTRMAFGILLVLVAARAMLLEAVRTSLDVWPDSHGGAAGAGATTALLLDLLCAVPALLVLARRVMDKEWRLRWSWSAMFFLALGGLAAASVAWSADRFEAAIGAADFLAAGAILWAAVQLVRSWRNFRLAAAVACGLLLVCLVKGFYEKYVEIPASVANRSAILAEAHIEPTGMDADQFMNRASELLGFFTSTNSFAAVLVMLMAITLGIAIQRLLDDGWGWGTTLLAPVAAGIWVVYLTACKATIGTGALALLIFGVIAARRGSGARRVEASSGYWAGVGAAGAGIAAGLAYGLHRGGLPTASLNFRWRYWIGTMRVVREHPILGVGWNNFYLYYVKDRLVCAVEDIRNPHNFLLRFLVELGAIGGIAAVAWLLRFWWEATRPDRAEVLEENGNRRSAPFVILSIAAIAAGIAMLPNMDFNMPTFPLLAELSLRIMYVLVLTLGGTLAASRSLENPAVDDRPAPWMLYGVLAGLGTLLVHNLIEFSLAEAGVLCLFALLAGSAVGIRMGPSTRSARSGQGDEKAGPAQLGMGRGAAIAALSGAGAVWALGVALVYVPVLRAEWLADLGDQDIRDSHMMKAAGEFGQAREVTPWNYDYAYRAGRAVDMERMRQMYAVHQAADSGQGTPSAISPELLNESIRDMDLALKENPLALAPLIMRAELLMELRDPANQAKGLADYRELERLNPANLEFRLQYMGKLKQMGKMDEAREQFAGLVRINDQFDAKEPRRLTPEQIEGIRKELVGAPPKR